MVPHGDMDSKFRYVIIASKRAKQLLMGAEPKIKSKSRSLIRIAQEEVKKGLIDYVIKAPQEEGQDEKQELLLPEELFNGEINKEKEKATPEESE